MYVADKAGTRGGRRVKVDENLRWDRRTLVESVLCIVGYKMKFPSLGVPGYPSALR